MAGPDPLGTRSSLPDSEAASSVTRTSCDTPPASPGKFPTSPQPQQVPSRVGAAFGNPSAPVRTPDTGKGSGRGVFRRAPGVPPLGLAGMTNQSVGLGSDGHSGHSGYPSNHSVSVERPSSSAKRVENGPQPKIHSVGRRASSGSIDDHNHPPRVNPPDHEADFQRTLVREEIRKVAMHLEAKLDAAVAGIENKLTEQRNNVAELWKEVSTRGRSVGNQGETGALGEPDHNVLISMIERLQGKVEEHSQGMLALEDRIVRIQMRFEEHVKHTGDAQREQLSETVVFRGRIGRIEAALKSMDNKGSSVDAQELEMRMGALESSVQNLSEDKLDVVHSAVKSIVNEPLNALEAAHALLDERVSAIRSSIDQPQIAPKEAARVGDKMEELEAKLNATISEQSSLQSSLDNRLLALESRKSEDRLSLLLSPLANIRPQTPQAERGASSSMFRAQSFSGSGGGSGRPSPLHRGSVGSTSASRTGSPAGNRTLNSDALAEVLKQRRDRCEEWVVPRRTTKQADAGDANAPGKDFEALPNPSASFPKKPELGDSKDSRDLDSSRDASYQDNAPQEGNEAVLDKLVELLERRLKRDDFTERLKKVETCINDHEKTMQKMRDGDDDEGHPISERLKHFEHILDDHGAALRKMNESGSVENEHLWATRLSNMEQSITSQSEAFEKFRDEHLNHAESVADERVRRLSVSVDQQHKQMASGSEALRQDLQTLERRLSSGQYATNASDNTEAEDVGQQLATFDESLRELSHLTSEHAAGNTVLRMQMEAKFRELSSETAELQSSLKQVSQGQESLQQQVQQQVQQRGVQEPGQDTRALQQSLSSLERRLESNDQSISSLREADVMLQQQTRALQQMLDRQVAQSGSHSGAPRDFPLDSSGSNAAAKHYAGCHLPLLSAALRRVEREVASVQQRIDHNGEGDDPAQLKTLHYRMSSHVGALRDHMVALQEQGGGEDWRARSSSEVLVGNYLRIVYSRVALVSVLVESSTKTLRSNGLPASAELQPAKLQELSRLQGEHQERLSKVQSRVEEEALRAGAVRERLEALAEEYRELKGLCGQGFADREAEVQAMAESASQRSLGTSLSVDDLRGFTPREETVALGQRLAAVERYVDDRLNKLQGVRRGLHQMAVSRGPVRQHAQHVPRQRPEHSERTGSAPPGSGLPASSLQGDDRVAAMEQRYLSMLEALVSS